jgi:hypothetical protein
MADSLLVRTVAEGLVRPPDEVLRKAFRSYTLNNYTAFVEACREQGVAVAFCTFAVPEPGHLSGAEEALLTANLRNFWRGKDISFRTYARYMAIYNTELEAFTEELKLPLVPVADEIRGGLELFVDICHLKDAGVVRKSGAIAAAICRDPERFGLGAATETSP